MKLTFCVVCGARNDLHHHHFIPKSHGGSASDANMITLCKAHHIALHAFHTPVEHGALIKGGIQRAKDRGVFLGPKPATLTAFTETKNTRTPVEEVLVRLYTVEQVTPGVMSTLTWLDIADETFTVEGVPHKISQETQGLIAKAIASQQLQGRALLQKISATPRQPEGANPNSMAQRLGRLKNEDEKRATQRLPKHLRPLTRHEAIEVGRKAIRLSSPPEG